MRKNRVDTVTCDPPLPHPKKHTLRMLKPKKKHGKRKKKNLIAAQTCKEKKALWVSLIASNYSDGMSLGNYSNIY